MKKGATGSRIAVIGAGMAGLVAAVRAQQLGADVVLLEKGETVGGTMAMSGGGIWCFQTYEGLRRVVPRGDADLCRTLVEDFPGAIQWLEALGAPVAGTPAAPYKGVDRWVFNMEPGCSQFAAHMLRLFQEGGWRPPARHVRHEARDGRRRGNHRCRCAHPRRHPGH